MKILRVTGWRTSTVILSLCLSVRAAAQSRLSSEIHIANTYRISPNIAYLKVGDVESKLDVYQARPASTSKPTLVYIHGGNWVGGSKEASSLSVLPFLGLGWNVVNIDYRLLNVAPAPAAVEDCRCALRWVWQHAKEFNIDTRRVVLSGNSAGGHLALLAAMAPSTAGFDRLCPGSESPSVAAVINWYGFPDLVSLLSGQNARPAVKAWIGAASDAADLGRRLSPATYIHHGLPPILTVHGDVDPVSPYEYAVKFHDSLEKAGVPNQLITVPGGKHGGFTDSESLRIFDAIDAFLRQHDVIPSTSTR